MSVCALVVAAGRGSRARLSEGDRVPKQYAVVGGKSVLARTVEAFVAHPKVGRVMVVVHRDDMDLYQGAVRGLSDKLEAPIFGGDTRQASVLAGLEALAESKDVPSVVMIHDAARPFVVSQSIDGVLGALDAHEGAVCAVPVADTLKRAGEDGGIVGTVDRNDLWRAQTPQAFRFKAILDAHRKAMTERGAVFTDDSGIAEWAGLKVALVMGAPCNDKLTSREDIAMADERLRARAGREGQFETRIGSGFDVHRFGPGDHVWLCGCRIDHTHALVGHSDADVGLHALTDAILGALGEGDIGQHFPPSDPKWKGARSDQFLADAVARVVRRGGAIINVDVTLVCELPKVGPHREAMRASIALIAGIDVSRVGVKATTTEKLGFTGRGEGIAAMASVSLKLPD